MNNQALLIDIGNTSIHFGLSKDNKIIQEWKIDTQKDLCKSQLLSLPILKELQTHSFQTIGFASVVPEITVVWGKILKITFSIPIYIVNFQTCSPFFDLKYDNPKEIGADRLCNILSCQRLNLKEVIIIDFGTATTFDIYYDKTYWGGIICLGITSSLNTLYKKASMLKKVDLRWNPKVTGQNTADAISNGILYGSIGQIEYLLKKIKLEHALKKPEIILTGGLSSIIQKQLSEGQVHPHFTLLGINYLIKKIQQKTF